MSPSLIFDYGLAIGTSMIIIGAGVWVMVTTYRKLFGDEDDE